MTLPQWGLLLLTAVAFATSLPFNKVLVFDIPPLTLAASRAVLAFPLMWLVATGAGHGLPSSRTAWGTATIGGVLIVAIPFCAIAWGQQFIPSGLGGVLYATMPLMTVALAHFLVRDERVSVRKLLGIAAGIAGVVAIIGPRSGARIGSGYIGEIVTLIAPLSYALGNLLLKRRPSLHPLELTTGMLLIGALVMIPVSIAVEGAQGFRFKQEHMLALFGLASIGTAVPALLNYVLVRATGATNASLVMFFMPLFALAFGILLLGETITASALFGMCFIIAGSRIVSRPS